MTGPRKGSPRNPSRRAVLGAGSVLRRQCRSGLILGALILAGCTAPRIPYTAADAAAAEIPKMAGVRVFADVPAPKFRKALCTNVNLNAAPGRAAAPAYLTLSSGGADGAYGAGCSTDGRPRGPDLNSRSCLE
jgi:hypothetical protein